MISPEARRELDRLFAERKPERPLEQRRREWEADARLAVLPKDARFTPVTAGVKRASLGRRDQLRMDGDAASRARPRVPVLPWRRL